MKTVAQSMGMLRSEIGTHSLRIGAATALMALGADPAVIQILGRWQSDVWRIYTRHTRHLMTGVASQLAKVDMEALVEESPSRKKKAPQDGEKQWDFQDTLGAQQQSCQQRLG